MDGVGELLTADTVTGWSKASAMADDRQAKQGAGHQVKCPQEREAGEHRDHAA
jgi:hypothetical protein